MGTRPITLLSIQDKTLNLAKYLSPLQRVARTGLQDSPKLFGVKLIWLTSSAKWCISAIFVMIVPHRYFHFLRQARLIILRIPIRKCQDSLYLTTKRDEYKVTAVIHFIQQKLHKVYSLKPNHNGASNSAVVSTHFVLNTPPHVIKLITNQNIVLIVAINTRSEDLINY